MQASFPYAFPSNRFDDERHHFFQPVSLQHVNESGQCCQEFVVDAIKAAVAENDDDISRTGF